MGDLPPSTREQVDVSSQVIKDALNLVTAVTFWTRFKTASAAMKGLAEFPRLAPGIGGLVSSLVNVVLAFISQEDTVLKELKKGFAEVNRKLDSLSKQISNLATDVEWFNYANVYSQDEVRILNTWNRFNEFRENSESVQSDEDKLRLVDIFTNYYENTGVEASVANLYHSLTVNGMSLGGNINQLLRKKLKCGISKIGRYNLYFSSLLWKGMVLNQLYWSLMGFNSSGKEGEHVQMFKKIYEAQRTAVEFCLDNYKQYNWYDWVVLVYDSWDDFILLELTEIPVGRIRVAVGFTVETGEKIDEDLQFAGSLCYYNKDCRHMSLGVRVCLATWPEVKFTEKVKVTHVTYGEDFVI